MVKIFKIRPDFSKAFAAPAEGIIGGEKAFCLHPMKDSWKVPVLYIKDPVRTKLGDFVNILSGAFAYRRNVDNGPVGEILSRAGEVLPASLEAPKEPLCVFNSTVVYNCLDQTKSVFRTTPDGTVFIQIKKYSFHLNRIGGVTIFKIPEMAKTEVFAITGRDSPDEEFYSLYHQLNYSGLLFEEVWNDQ